jgi:fatty-acyl-CoA synthase
VLLSHAQAVAQTARMTPDDVVLAALPPCGAYGHGLILAALSAGATAILVREYAVERIVNAIESEQVTVMALTEPLLKKILDHAAAHRKSLRSLRIVFSAGGTLQPVVERAEAEFGFRITNVYGSSEVLALAAFWGFDGSAAERSAAGGRLVSAGMRVRAVDSAGIPVTPGMPGELQFAGPVVTSGYLVNEAATRNAFTTDGWFKSGDLGSVDDESGRRFHYVARLNDALRLKGFLVNPGEIEEMLQSHPDVSAAQVVGLSEKSGEDLAAAFVVLRPHASADADALRTFCRARMASYKVPTLLEIVPKFPMTRSANGDKVMKNRLRDMAQEMLTNE